MTGKIPEYEAEEDFDPERIQTYVRKQNPMTTK
jgi:hypothetical protein